MGGDRKKKKKKKRSGEFPTGVPIQRAPLQVCMRGRNQKKGKHKYPEKKREGVGDSVVCLYFNVTKRRKQKTCREKRENQKSNFKASQQRCWERKENLEGKNVSGTHHLKGPT